MTEQRIRRAVLIVALLNFGYFFVEFAAAIAIGSASLFADSADFLEDTAINMLVFFAVAWPSARRRKAGSVLAALILIPAIAAIVTVVLKIMNPEPPSPEGLTGVAVGALVVNLICAVILLRLRNEGPRWPPAHGLRRVTTPSRMSSSSSPACSPSCGPPPGSTSSSARSSLP